MEIRSDRRSALRYAPSLFGAVWAVLATCFVVCACAGADVSLWDLVRAALLALAMTLGFGVPLLFWAALEQKKRVWLLTEDGIEIRHGRDKKDYCVPWANVEILTVRRFGLSLQIKCTVADESILFVSDVLKRDAHQMYWHQTGHWP